MKNPETLVLSTVTGGLAPLVARRYVPGKVSKLGIQSVWDLFAEPGIDLGLLMSVPTIGLSMMGADGKGPLSGNDEAITALAGMGGGALASTLAISMYTIKEEAEAAGLTLAPSKPAGKLQTNGGDIPKKTEKETGFDMSNPAGI